MKKYTIQILEDHTDEVLNATEEGIERALEAIGMQVENYAKVKCPVDTGLLRNSLTHAVSPDEKCVYVGSNVEYAAYVELGTQRTNPQPYLKPAVMDHVEELKHIAEDALSGNL